MPEYITVTEKIERRTYLKGNFSGKFVGYLDENNSDLKTENFYDLEITDARVRADRADFRTWREGDEFEEFTAVKKFLTKLPKPMPCDIRYEDGSHKHFNLDIQEPKLINYRLYNHLYEKNVLFAAIEGEISGYLRHFDTEEKQIEVVPPADFPPETPTLEPNLTNTEARQASGRTGNFKWSSSGNQRSGNPGCLPTLGVSVFTSKNGCLSLIGIILIAYFCFAVIIMILSAVAKLIGATVIFLSLLFSALLPILLIGSLLFIFTKLQNKLPRVLKWLFLFLIAWIVLIFCLS